MFYKCICHTSEFMSFNLNLQDFGKQQKLCTYIYISEKITKGGVLAPIHQKITKSRDQTLLEVMEVTSAHNLRKKICSLSSVNP